MKVWTPTENGGKNHYAGMAVLGVIGIVALAMLMSTALAVLSITLSMSKTLVFLLYLLGTGVTVWLAFLLRRRLHREELLFCLDEQDRLFIIQAGMYMDYRRGIWGYSEMSMEIQKKIERVKKQMFIEHKVPAIAMQILKVERLKERTKGFSIVCHVYTGDGRAFRRKWTVSGKYEHEEELLWQFRRRLVYKNP